MASVQELIKGKKYKLVVELGYLPSGKRDRRTRTVEASGKRAAKRMLKEFEDEVMEKMNLNEEMFFVSFTEKWLNNYAKPELEKPTLENYKSALQTISDYFIDFRMKDITPLSITEYFNYEKEQGRASLEAKYKVLLSIYKYAVKWKVIKEEDNPMVEIEMPKPSKKQNIDFYRAHEIPILMEAIQTLDIKNQIITKLALFGGLRRGEIAGLAADVCDFKNNRIEVKRSLQHSKTGGLRLKETKEEDTRLVVIPAALMKELHTYYIKRLNLKMEMGPLWKGFKDINDNEVFLIFADEYGVPYRPDAISKFWKRFMKTFEGKIRRVRFHDLRHSSATIALTEGAREGITSKTIQKRLGHKDIKTTLKFYSHVTEEDDKKASDVFDKYL
ncbi:hypothetical protein DCC39_14370 [Pueribacillus theae]|uniref:Site-specific integrase n=1 Tax=Pueribacillus theae TaxID=2171751 RepID=A0A2U1JTW9_9BACI|nr:site-specific integrase [Pueribacillus theae]PWA08621.1 hypothetical protein DCC39_14370 [Pueribacillus theae]